MKKNYCTPRTEVIKLGLNLLMVGSTTTDGEDIPVMGEDAKVGRYFDL